jgi:integrase
MASLFKKKDCKNWIACFRDKAGRQKRYSTREPNRRKAQLIADQYEHIARGGVRQRDFREIMTGLYRKLYGVAVPVTTIRVYAQRWLTVRKTEVQVSTWCTYSRVIRDFEEFLGGGADGDIADVSKEQLFGFRDKLADSISAGSANSYMKVLKLFFKGAKEDGFLSESPAEFMHSIKETASRVKRRAFTPEELRRLLVAADPEERSLVLFALYTGQRLGDICMLRWENIDLERGERGSICLVTKKTRKQMRIPIAGRLRDHIASLPSSDDPRAPLHPWFDMQYRRKTLSTIHWRLAQLFKNAGLQSKEARPDSQRKDGRKAQHALTFHSLRHTTVSLLKDAGVPDAVVMEIVGHSTVAMSQHYTHTGWEAMCSGMDKMPVL